MDGCKIGEIYCECAKGKDKCHHMAAILIYSSKHISATDIPCQWNTLKNSKKKKTFEELFGEPKFKALKTLVKNDICRNSYTSLNLSESCSELGRASPR
jgi:hypothetical protein